MFRFGMHLGNGVKLTGTDKWCLENLPIGSLVFLPSWGHSQQPLTPEYFKNEVASRVDVNEVDFILRPYIPPEMVTGPLPDMESVLRTLEEGLVQVLGAWTEVIPEERIILQVFNEPNMPRWATGYEGFGSQPDDIVKHDTMLCWLLRDDGLLSPWNDVRHLYSPMTIGNNDVWFEGDPPQEQYYLHADIAEPNDAWPDVGHLPSDAMADAVRRGLGYESLCAADMHGVHCYIHYDQPVTARAYGMRLVVHDELLSVVRRDTGKEMPIVMSEGGYPNRTLLDWDYRDPDRRRKLFDWFTALASYENLHSVNLWICGDNPQWGGQMWNDKQSFLKELGQHWMQLSNAVPPVKPPEDLSCSTIPLQAEKVRWYHEQLVRDIEMAQSTISSLSVRLDAMRNDLLANISRAYELENTAKRCIDG